MLPVQVIALPKIKQTQGEFSIRNGVMFVQKCVLLNQFFAVLDSFVRFIASLLFADAVYTVSTRTDDFTSVGWRGVKDATSLSGRPTFL
jgi:hypothetical protein